MHVELLNMYNVHMRAAGVAKCLSDGFGEIDLEESQITNVLLGKMREGHLIVNTIVDTQVVATATGFIEQKLIHGGDPKYKALRGPSYVMHIEDVATRTDKRGNGYGAAAVKALNKIAEEEGCYKIILDASVGNYENFYSKLGYSKSELCLRKNVK